MPGPCSPRDVPILSVARTRLSINQELMRQLSASRQVRLEIVDGCPVLIPDRDGWAITTATSGHEYTGCLAAPAVLEVARVLPVGSKWEMRVQKGSKRWVGTRWEQTETKRPDYIRLPRAMFEQMRAELAELRRRVEQAG